MKKFFSYLLVFLAFLTATLYLTVNSSFVIDKVAKKFAPKYGISYKEITGNPLSGVSLHKVYYKEYLLADEITIKLNPSTLLKKKITISKLLLNGVDKKSIMHMVDEINNKDKNVTKDDSSSDPFSFSIQINELHISTKPLEISGVTINNFTLDSDYVFYSNDTFDFDNLSMKADTSVGKLNIIAQMQNQVLSIENILLSRIDSKEIESILNDINSSSDEQSTETKQDKSKEKQNIFIPTKVNIKKIHIDSLDREYSGVNISDLSIDGKDIYYNIAKPAVSASINLKAKTTLGDIDTSIEYEGYKINILDLKLKSLNSLEIERLIQNINKQEKNNPTKVDTTTDKKSEQSIFIPTTVTIKNTNLSLMRGEYDGINISKLTLDSKNISIDLNQSTLSGEISLNGVTDLAQVNFAMSISPENLVINSISIDKINIDKVIVYLDRNSSKSKESNKTVEKSKTAEAEKTNKTIPYLPKNIKIVNADMKTLTGKYQDITIKKFYLHAQDFHINISKERISSGHIAVEIESDIADIRHISDIKDNSMRSNTSINPKNALIDKYNLPLRDGAISSITIDALSDINQSKALVKFNGKKLLNGKKDAFNIDTMESELVAKYTYKTKKLLSKLNTHIKTTYTDDIALKMNFNMLEDKIDYNGVVDVPKISGLGLDKNITDLLNNAQLSFDGDSSSVEARLSSNALKGNFVSKDFKKGKVHIESKKAIRLTNLISLPSELEEAKAKISINAPIDFNQTTPLHIKASIASNMANINMNAVYDQNKSKASAKITIPKNTILKKFDKKIIFSAISPMNINIKQKSNKIDIKLKTKTINLSAYYNTKSTKIVGNLDISGTKLNISAPNKDNISIKQNAKSIQALLKSVTDIYKIKSPKISGDLSMVASIKSLKSASVTLKSNKIIIGENEKSGTKISNIMLQLSGNAKGAKISKYKLTTSGVDIYANKASNIRFENGNINISELWINDNLKVKGIYNIEKSSGEVTANASEMKINHEIIDTLTTLNLKVKLSGDKTDIAGAIHLKGGKVKYNMSKKSFSTDSDIIILQRQKKKKKSGFKKNFKTEITLDSSKPLIYKAKGIYIKATPNLKITKKYGGKLKIYGDVSLSNGGYYKFQNKKFIISKNSKIRFKGRANAPILAIRIIYKHLGTKITIRVAGIASNPTLNFSSTPPMSREQILSYILFDSGNGAGSKQTADMANLMAGSLAKSLLSSMGIRLDHLVLTGTGFEVGKKISDNISIIYDQSEKASVKVRIQNTKNINTDISFGSDSQSADIFYKKEF